MTTSEFEKLLKLFIGLPKEIREPTYLELCKYPRRRFEEICSRLLCFYFNPNKEHNLKNLFLSSLLELIAPHNNYYLNRNKINVINEENADGKKIDILIYSEMFVIGIENKINADLYNPLEAYKNRIQQYSSENIFLIVLSLRKLKTKKDIDFITENSFTNFTYYEYFTIVKKNLSSFSQEANSKYLNSLFDFIETIENMTTNTILNEELSNFFYENTEQIDNLIKLYNQYNSEVLSIQMEKISEIKENIINLTNDNKWWVWKGWDLGINEFNLNKPKIGIESFFEASKGYPLGKFRIMITAWSLKDWSHYEIMLKKIYSNCKIEKKDNRAFLHVDCLIKPEDDEILTCLKRHYFNLINITSSELV